jgi:stage III sporulation protein AA
MAKHTGPFAGIVKYLPERIARVIDKTEHVLVNRISELRLYRSGPLTLCDGAKNIYIDEYARPCGSANAVRITGHELDGVLNKLCGGSYHAQEANIKRGFIMADGGVRAGLAGTFSPDNAAGGYILDQVYSVSLRICRSVQPAPGALSELIARCGLCGILLYSLPAQGKTTQLRMLAMMLSQGRFGLPVTRTALIDERCELYIPGFMDGGVLDVLSGCPKGEAIELAVRTLNPQVIICDEIGGAGEGTAVRYAANSGVPLVASVHCGSHEQLYRRPFIRELLDAGIFAYTVGLRFDGVNARYDIKEVT